MVANSRERWGLSWSVAYSRNREALTLRLKFKKMPLLLGRGHTQIICLILNSLVVFSFFGGGGKRDKTDLQNVSVVFWDSDVTVIVCYSVWVLFKRHMSFDEIQPRWSPMELQSASINVFLVDVHSALYFCCRDMHHGEAAAKITQKNTLPKFNIAPENDSWKTTFLWDGIFWGKNC